MGRHVAERVPGVTYTDVIDDVPADEIQRPSITAEEFRRRDIYAARAQEVIGQTTDHVRKIGRAAIKDVEIGLRVARRGVRWVDQNPDKAGACASAVGLVTIAVSAAFIAPHEDQETEATGKGMSTSKSVQHAVEPGKNKTLRAADPLEAYVPTEIPCDNPERAARIPVVGTAVIDIFMLRTDGSQDLVVYPNENNKLAQPTITVTDAITVEVCASADDLAKNMKVNPKTRTVTIDQRAIQLLPEFTNDEKGQPTFGITPSQNFLMNAKVQDSPLYSPASRRQTQEVMRLWGDPKDPMRTQYRAKETVQAEMLKDLDKNSKVSSQVKKLAQQKIIEKIRAQLAAQGIDKSGVKITFTSKKPKKGQPGPLYMSFAQSHPNHTTPKKAGYEIAHVTTHAGRWKDGKLVPNTEVEEIS